MKCKQILDAFSEVKEEYVTESSPLKTVTERHHWIKWGVLAACFSLVVLGVTALILGGPVKPAPNPQNPVVSITDPDKLPILPVTDNFYEGGSFEGLMAYEISELVDKNPWSESEELTTLPVYKNKLTYQGNTGHYLGADKDKMKELLLNVAGRLGMDVDNLKITDNTPMTFPEASFIIADKGITIEVDEEMTATITFAPAISLPEEYNFNYNSTYEECEAIAEYLKEEYKDLLGMQDPQINIDGGDYSRISDEGIPTIDPKTGDINYVFTTLGYEQKYSIEFYEADGDNTSQIINYNFNKVIFYSDGDGKLDMVRVFQPDISDKVGDYPIITVEKAKELLKNGNFVTTVVDEEMPGMEYVAKVELVYRTGLSEKYFMPYYRFYLELPNLEENGMKTYGAYYVPAVEGKYLSNMPIWDGSFN